MKKKYLLFAGVNGAGKSTLFSLAAQGVNEMPHVNADDILSDSGGDWRNFNDYALAMRKAVALVNEYMRDGVSFCQESTLSGKSIIAGIKRAKTLGYSVNMRYVGLESADLAVKRVALRVSLGGHGIDTPDIIRRYGQSLANLKEAIQMCNSAVVYDNTITFAEVARYKDGVEVLRRDHELGVNWLGRALNERGIQTPDKALDTWQGMSITDWETAIAAQPSANKAPCNSAQTNDRGNTSNDLDERQ